MKICICCSLTFTDEVNEVAKMLENLGHEVLLPNGVIHRLAEQPGFDPVQAKIDTDSLHAHFDKIRSSDAVLVCNFLKNCTPGYIGANSFVELAAARYFGKPIYALFPLPDFAYINDEIRSFDIKVLNYDLTQLPASSSYIGYSTRQLSFPESIFSVEPATSAPDTTPDVDVVASAPVMPAASTEPAQEPNLIASTPISTSVPASTSTLVAPDVPAPSTVMPETVLPPAPTSEAAPTSGTAPASGIVSTPETVSAPETASASDATPAPEAVSAQAVVPPAVLASSSSDPTLPILPTVDPAVEQPAAAGSSSAPSSADERKSLLTQVRDNWFAYWNRHQRH